MTTHKKKIFTTFLMSLVTVVGAMFATTLMRKLGMCGNISSPNGISCYTMEGQVIFPIFALSSAVLTSLIPLYFTKEAAWRTWWKFAVVYLPLAAIWIPNVPTSSFLFGNEQESLTFILSGLFVIISFLIALKKHFEK